MAKKWERARKAAGGSGQRDDAFAESTYRKEEKRAAPQKETRGPAASAGPQRTEFFHVGYHVVIALRLLGKLSRVLRGVGEGEQAAMGGARGKMLQKKEKQKKKRIARFARRRLKHK